MNLKGFIKSVTPSLDKTGNVREWANAEGTVYSFFEVVLTLPYAKNDGSTGSDELLVEICKEKVQGQQLPYADFIGKTDKTLTLTIFSKVREYNKRLFNSLRLSNVTVNAE